MKYVKKRGSRYHYVRRVPKDIRHIDHRDFIQLSLKTDSLTLAQQRAALLDQHIEEYWHMLLSGTPEEANKLYQRAIRLVRFSGVGYRSAKDIAEEQIEHVVKRVLLASQTSNDVQVKALLGGIDKPPLPLSEILPVYWDLSKDKLLGKSDDQIRKWKNPRIKAVDNFIKIIGDRALAAITRDDVLNFKDWWVERICEESLTPNSANKDFNHLRGVLQCVNDNLRLDLPILKLFERINIKDSKISSRLSFTPAFVQDTLLNQKTMSGLSEEFWLFICAMADTGARISELVGLDFEAGDIMLDGDIPSINIRANKIRKLKTPHSERILPLVGSALYAFQQIPKGFKRYASCPDSLSSAINKWLRENNIKPSPYHSLYSLRHCFQDRLIAVEAPDRVQAELMGHKFHRPKYGAGASLEQKHKWLNDIAFNAHF